MPPQKRQKLPTFKSLYGHLTTSGRNDVLSTRLGNSPYRIILRRPYGTYNREFIKLMQVQKYFFQGDVSLGDFYDSHRNYINSLI